MLIVFPQFSMGQEDDNHIFRFVKSKFGYVDETDFETRLYLCLSVFQALGWDYIEVRRRDKKFHDVFAIIFFFLFR